MIIESEDTALIAICTVAGERMRQVLLDAETAHVHAPYCALVNLIADAVMAHETPESFYEVMLQDVRTVYAQKLQSHVSEASRATIN